MLNPQSSVLVLVDAPRVQEANAAGSQLPLVINCARVLSIPIFRAAYLNDAPESKIQAADSSSGSVLRLPLEPDVEKWQTTVLAQAIAETGRRQLLICGHWLEEGVTLLALRAIRTGLDAYVCIDACEAIQRKHVATLQMRLVQHNIVVTTTEQAVREWIALCPIEKRHIAMLLLEIPPSRS